jgi:hypothetical protein
MHVSSISHPVASSRLPWGAKVSFSLDIGRNIRISRNRNLFNPWLLAGKREWPLRQLHVMSFLLFPNYDNSAHSSIETVLHSGVALAIKRTNFLLWLLEHFQAQIICKVTDRVLHLSFPNHLLCYILYIRCMFVVLHSLLNVRLYLGWSCSLSIHINIY